MNIIVCLDDKSGMMFHKRRQSMDRALRKHMLEFTAAESLYMSPYSASQFAELPDHVTADESFLLIGTEQDYYFVEDACWELFADRIREIVVYRWNRVYPADRYFPEAELSRRKLIHREDFAGYSHDRITQEVYTL